LKCHGLRKSPGTSTGKDSFCQLSDCRDVTAIYGCVYCLHVENCHDGSCRYAEKIVPFHLTFYYAVYLLLICASTRHTRPSITGRPPVQYLCSQEHIWIFRKKSCHVTIVHEVCWGQSLGHMTMCHMWTWC